ncbi:myosuppressin [Prorops nasuta]|uniref:myosuppressin n=1 Tax=Prorops nasuta TaxID=863751 RepID=UPI0034CEB838
MNGSIFFFISMATVGVLLDESFALPPIQCNPGLFNKIPPRIQKVCDALSTIHELGVAMENYIDDNVSDYQKGIPLPGSGVKRQDVDHVFLRFG